MHRKRISAERLKNSGPRCCSAGKRGVPISPDKITASISLQVLHIFFNDYHYFLFDKRGILSYAKAIKKKMEGMTMNAIQLKIQKTSRIVSILTKILYIFLIVVLSAEIVRIVWLIVLSDRSSVTLGNMKILAPVTFDGGASLKIIAGLLGVVVAQAFALPILILTHRIFRDISREYTPFMEKHIKRMKKIALLLLISSLIAPLLYIVSSSLIPYLNSVIQPGYESIIFAIIVYCFALIFQYGSALQQQSDETL
jgi:hypothetical protein